MVPDRLEPTCIGWVFTCCLRYVRAGFGRREAIAEPERCFCDLAQHGRFLAGTSRMLPQPRSDAIAVLAAVRDAGRRVRRAQSAGAGPRRPELRRQALPRRSDPGNRAVPAARRFRTKIICDRQGGGHSTAARCTAGREVMAGISGQATVVGVGTDGCDCVVLTCSPCRLALRLRMWRGGDRERENQEGKERPAELERTAVSRAVGSPS